MSVGRQAGPRSAGSQVLVWRDFILPGSETFIRNQVDALVRWEPLLVGIRNVDSPLRRASDVVLFGDSFLSRVERKIFTAFGWSPRLNKLLRQRGVTLIHAHFGMGAVSIARTARRLRIPLVVTVHGNDVTRADLRRGADSREGRVYARRLTRALRYAASVVAVSNFVAEQVREGYDVPAPKVSVLRIGIPTDVSFDGGGSEYDILFAGRLVAKKGVSDLLAAVELASHRISPPSVGIIGDGKLRARLEAEAREWGMNATFLGAQRPDVVDAAMRNCLVFVAPSRTAPDGDAEGFGMVFLEAARAARPVVAYAHGGVSEAVVDGDTGILVPEGDIAALADAIVRVLGDAELRARMGTAGRRRVLEEFDIRECTAELEDEFDRVAGGGG